jgi:hypothetical protein
LKASGITAFNTLKLLTVKIGGNMTWKEMREYLQHIMSFYIAYHNHKETSAWAAVIFFVLIIFQIPNVINTQVLSVNLAIVYTILLLIILLAAWRFIHIQLYLKKDSSQIFSACSKIIAENLEKSDQDPVEGSYKKGPKCSGDSQSDHILPQFITDKADTLEGIGRKASKGLDCVKYFLLIIVCLIAVLIIWFHLSIDC